VKNSILHFDLPAHLIAQHPIEPRDACRLLVVDRSTDQLQHQHFFDLPSLLRPGDLLVLNDSRVIPARLLGKRQNTGGKWEGLFLQELPEGRWELLAKSGGKPQPGEMIEIHPEFHLILEKREDSHWIAIPKPAGNAIELLEKIGSMPLPPYIRKGLAEDRDKQDYQTVYAQPSGSVAAPTAGLHFTDRVFHGLKERGVETATVTLHVGLGTFEPMRTDDPKEHVMHGEWGCVAEATVDKILACQARGGRVIAVGTTATRTLETAAKSGTISAFSGFTNHFIYPPYDWKVVDGLITNFHLPQTTLLLLVAAMIGEDRLMQAYQEAIRREYRFFSYGDAMLILP
jgi:S-adenosylmethionine:tRNA ribosyltransferase-isomerase